MTLTNIAMEIKCPICKQDLQLGHDPGCIVLTMKDVDEFGMPYCTPPGTMAPWLIQVERARIQKEYDQANQLELRLFVIANQKAFWIARLRRLRLAVWWASIVAAITAIVATGYYLL